MEASPLPKVQKSKEYKLESEGKIFSIKILLSSNIIFEIYELEIIQYSFYTKEFSLEDLIKISKIFKVCESINEAYDIIEEIFEAKNSSIKLREDNTVLLNININLPGGKTQNAEVSLSKKEINKNKLIEELVKKVNILEEKNKNLEEEVKGIQEWKKKMKNYLRMI